MNQATPVVDLENELANLLRELSHIQDEILAVLAEKRDRIVAGDLPAMQQLQAREQDLADRLQACHGQRNTLLHDARQQGLTADTLGELSQQVPGANRRALQDDVKRTSARMRLLQHESLANWVLAQRSLLHVGQLLEIIATGGQIQPTYGNGPSNHGRGALVDEQV